MKPVIKYRGGKSKEISTLIKYFPKEYDTYIEPFFGGGAMYFYLEPKKAIINDINPKLMSFYFDLKQNYGRLKSELGELQTKYDSNQQKYASIKINHPDERIPNDNESFYYEMRNEFNYPTGKYLYGSLYFFINKTAYSGMIRYNSNGEYNVPFGRYKNFNTDMITDSHHELLKRTKVFNKDYQEIFDMAKETDFIFLDPPYDCVFNDYGNASNHVDGFTEKEQRRLCTAFKKLKCKAVMVVAKTPLIEELYGDMIVYEYAKDYSVNIRNRFKNSASHVIITNFKEG